jgi:ABC-type sugar transport system substrate-binding protein
MNSNSISHRVLAAVSILCLITLCSAGVLAQTKKPQTASPTAQTAQPAGTRNADEAYPRPPKPAKQYTIGLSVPQLNNPHFVNELYGYMDEAEKLGVKLVVVEAGGYQKIDRQVSQIEDLIAHKVSAIIMSATSSSGTVGVVERAISLGIPVSTSASTVDTPKITTWVRSDDETIGRMQADFMGEALHGKGNVVMLPGPPGVMWAERRRNAFRARVTEKFPGLKIIGEQYSESSPVEGLRIMEDFLQTFPKIDGVYNGADTMAIGASQAITAAGQSGKIVVTTTDFQPDTVNFMRRGTVSAMVVQQAVLIGRFGIRAAVNNLEGRTVPKQILIPPILVTRDDLPKMDLRRFSAPEGWKPPIK